MAPEEIRAVLEQAGAERVEAADAALRGFHVDATVPAGALRAAVQALRDREFLIEDVTAVDVAPRMMAVYHFARVDTPCRVQLRVFTDRDEPAVPSVQDIYPGANWHERETHDFYGIVFEGHPDLSPLILPEDAGDLRPLRKKEKKLKELGAVVPELAPAGEEAPAPQAPAGKPEKTRPTPSDEADA
ncbi:MAG: hypothetical protein Kow0092_16590 [Deferrisomatales bacterium]